jgi:sulfite exporter TauE/SafE
MDALLPAMLVLGLASGLHCVGMCGGIVGAFAAADMIPIRPAEVPLRPQWLRVGAFNAGRVSSYAAGGALAGALGSAGAYAAGAVPVQSALYVFANVLLVVVGLYLAGLAGWLARLEALGAPLWRRLQPLAARLLPARSLPHAYAAGTVWGWLPCGLVYGALAAATLAGTPARGALAMAAFGLGTLPWLLGAGLAAARLRRLASRPAWRLAAGALVLGLGVAGLARSAEVSAAVRAGLLCLV